MEDISLRKIFEYLLVIINSLVIISGLPFTNTMECLVVILIMDLGYLLLGGNVHRNKNTKAKILMLTITSFVCIGYFYAFSRSNLIPYILRFIIFTIMFFFFIYDKSLIKKIIKFTAVYGIIVAISILFDAILLGNNEPSGFLINYQKAGQAMSILSMISAIYVVGPNNKNKFLYIIAFLLGFLALLTTGKRMFSLLPLLALLITYILHYRKNVNINLLLGGFLAIIVVVIIINISPSIANTITRFIESSEDKTFSSRTLFWDLAMDIYRDNKVIGIGFGNYPAYLEWLQPYNIPSWSAHNIYYQLLAETGIVGITLFTLFFSYFLIMSIYVVIKNRYDILSYVSLGIQIWFLVYGISGNPLYMPDEMYIYLIALAITNYQLIQMKQSKRGLTDEEKNSNFNISLCR